ERCSRSTRSAPRTISARSGESIRMGRAGVGTPCSCSARAGALAPRCGRLSAALYSLKHLAPLAADPLGRVLSRGIKEERHRHAGTLLRVAAAAEQDDVLLHFAGEQIGRAH